MESVRAVHQQEENHILHLRFGPHFLKRTARPVRSIICMTDLLLGKDTGKILASGRKYSVIFNSKFFIRLLK